jgi:hypothetical protein
MNVCRSCGDTDFASVTAFDKHRLGTYAYPWGPDREDGRRCLIGDELTEAGMELDPRGRWRIALTDERRAELAALRSPENKTVRAERASST